MGIFGFRLLAFGSRCGRIEAAAPAAKPTPARR